MIQNEIIQLILVIFAVHDVTIIISKFEFRKKFGKLGICMFCQAFWLSLIITYLYYINCSCLIWIIYPLALHNFINILNRYYEKLSEPQNHYVFLDKGGKE
jgi:hypothetical protein